jgi:PAS domain S-box-containing protein
MACFYKSIILSAMELKEMISTKALSASELSYRRLFEAAQDGILILDVEEGRVTDVNPFLCKLLGFSPSEMIGCTVGELSPFMDIVSNQAMLEKLQEHGYVRYEDLPLETRDGRKIAVEFVSNVYRAGDKNVIQCNIRDITKRKESQEQLSNDATEVRLAARILKTHAEELEQKVLVRTLELQSTISELEAFSYTVSHDLRAPLRAMQGYTHVLLEDFADKWGNEERDLLNRINKAAERLDILIQDLLTYSKVSKRRQAIVPVNLDRLVQDILTQYPTFQDAQLSIEVLRPLEPVMGNESGLTQVISNLLTNAVKFTSPDRPQKIRVWTEAKEFTVRLWIEDNGIGIDSENHLRIFKMFEQVDGKRFEGTGMGLAIAAKGVEGMQGSIGLESNLGSGTKLWIELLKPKKV